MPKTVGLAVLASDAISSTAYASEEILLVLMPLAGLAALDNLIPISLIVMVLLIIVVSSYRQTIYAYPSGGGSYQVSKENLGEMPGLVAGASLLVDYTLTVAVSISAGTAAVVSAFPELIDYRVPICLGGIALLTVANLRGVRESGRVFAVPTYVYVVSLGALLAYGLYRSYFGGLDPLPSDQSALNELTDDGTLMTGITAFALMRAFSSGAVALTGVEAISNGVPAFRRPESRNASITLMWMGAILAVSFFGISVLAHRLQPTVTEDETLLSILARAVYGDGALYFVLQAATAAILFLAANTAFAGFPRISSILAQDGYLPRQLANRGDRLVFSNGILLLAVIAGGLIVMFGGITTALIPLYAVGVFTGFTLSQAGMVRYQRRRREPAWRRHAAINAIGAVATGVVLVVVVVSKFTIGAWVPVVLIPAQIVLLKSIKRHYDRVRAELRIPEGWRPPEREHTVVILVGGVHRGVLAALAYARALQADQMIALSVVKDDEEEARLREAWEAHDCDVELQTLHSPFRELTRPVLEWIDELDAQRDDDIITVIIPEFVVDHWWDHLLHNQSALVLKGRLLFRKNTVVTSVPWHLGSFDDVPTVEEAEEEETERTDAEVAARGSDSET